ncbi:hypothetical protein O181_014526 [Austropuccinia psidii MF-1]|uniref:Uncharacterized protein n=1 Tax=Austropuccinia psidii MF-1 TaxID=1389203 RepID=A0A9Q3BY97_9BASI|nr:hypothetical protein [Austropuccinia psidii MF-1]
MQQKKVLQDSQGARLQRRGPSVCVYLEFKQPQKPKENERLIFGTIHYNQIDRKDAAEIRPTEEFSSKHAAFLVILVKPYHQTGENKFPSRNKIHTAQDIVEVGDFPGSVKRIMKVRNIRLNCKDNRNYLVRFKKQTADKLKGRQRIPYQIVRFT